MRNRPFRDDKHGAELPAANRWSGVDDHLGEVAIEKESIAATELEEQSREVPKIHRLPLVRDGKDELVVG